MMLTRPPQESDLTWVELYQVSPVFPTSSYEGGREDVKVVAPATCAYQ